MHALACRPIALPAPPRMTRRGPLSFIRFRLLCRPFLAVPLAVRA